MTRPPASASPCAGCGAFQRVTLQPGQTESVRFTLTADDFGFYDNMGCFVVGPGKGCEGAQAAVSAGVLILPRSDAASAGQLVFSSRVPAVG